MRPVPYPPELTALVHQHVEKFGTSPDGHIFVGHRDREAMPKGTVARVRREARAAAFPPEVAASPLAKTLYDLWHAAVSTWLNGGVHATTVAEWAGQSVDILHRIYAKCLDRGRAPFQQMIDRTLGN